MSFLFFFFNDTATTEIYTLSLHDALPISFRDFCSGRSTWPVLLILLSCAGAHLSASPSADRKSTRLNSSHQIISYAVFCLKKKKKSKLTARHDHSPRSSRTAQISSEHERR